ncbi:Clp protease N-terminal domain-containing protein [Leucobacter sp. NPDC058333]|uniref:Clp protease N-terminal domain-containing protein n=1 Tax=Leucobacter sp. NPDC058333 TaxID=3346450 RepID=UPI00364F7D3D
MFEKFARSARTAVVDARSEAALRGDRRVGAEHLLLALLREPPLAQAFGADADQARAAADALDRAALAAVGIDLGAAPLGAPATLGKHVPFTSAAKGVLRDALKIASSERARSITAGHLGRALLERPDPDPAAALISALSIDRAAASQRLIDR